MRRSDDDVRRRRRNAPTSRTRATLLLFVSLLLLLLVRPTATSTTVQSNIEIVHDVGTVVVDASVEVRVLALAATATHRNVTQAVSPQNGKDHDVLDQVLESSINGEHDASATQQNTTTRLELGVRVGDAFKVAVFRVHFDSAMEVVWGEDHACSLGDESVRCAAAVDGLVRLQCGRAIFESHDFTMSEQREASRLGSSKSPQRTPMYFVPWQQTHRLPFVRMLEPVLHALSNEHVDDATAKSEQDSQLVGVLVLAKSTIVDGKRTIHTNLEESVVDQCRLRVLRSTSQTVKPWRRLRRHSDPSTFYEGSIDHFRTVLSSSSTKPATPDRSTCSASTKLSQSFYRQPWHPAYRGHDDVESLKKLQVELLRTQRFLDDQAVQVFMDVTFDAKGMLEPLVKPAVKPVVGLMANVVADTVAPAVGKPIADLVSGSFIEGVTAGVEPYLTDQLVDNITPSLTETVTDMLIEIFTNELADYIVEHVTPRATDEITEQLIPSVVPEVVNEMGTEGVVVLARTVAHSLSHILVRAVPHAIVPALTSALTHSPILDYYCYYCNKYKMYCEYCKPGAPQQSYYSLYYTGFYSSYYSVYYADQKHLGVKLVRKRKTNFEDEREFDPKKDEEGVFNAPVSSSEEEIPLEFLPPPKGGFPVVYDTPY